MWQKRFSDAVASWYVEECFCFRCWSWTSDSNLYYCNALANHNRWVCICVCNSVVAEMHWQQTRWGVPSWEYSLRICSWLVSSPKNVLWEKNLLCGIPRALRRCRRAQSNCWSRVSRSVSAPSQFCISKLIELVPTYFYTQTEPSANIFAILTPNSLRVVSWRKKQQQTIRN